MVIDSSLGQSEKADPSIFVIDTGIVMLLIPECAKAETPKLVIEEGCSNSTVSSP
ncbi:MAG: hypothetical protein Q8P34_04905 [Bacteroidota bacterium]|nr:hypothetical protein [Bacteroidota bacterium]